MPSACVSLRALLGGVLLGDQSFDGGQWVGVQARRDKAGVQGVGLGCLTAPTGHPPRLSVTNRRAAVGDDIWADHRAYYYSWGEWIAPISDPQTAARMITSVLRTTPQPARG